MAGKVKGIGVSNYTVSHLAELLGYSTTGPPEVLQSEFHPRFHQREVREFCDTHGIQFMGYTPLGRNDLAPRPAVQAVASRNNITPSQVLLKWALQKGVVTIPRSSNPERCVENAQSWVDEVVLGEEDVKELDAMEDGHRYCANPDLV